jgi:acyl-CoA synthetase (AMP-forming)/AMP-acid ligase II
LRKHGAAAFGFLDDGGEERLVIVQEVERSQRHRLDPAAIVTRIREAVTREHDIAPFAIALIRPGTLPKTTSGKVQRGLARQLWQHGGLDLL